ncbi:hypothetical protein Tco_0577719 [Tanacetum coccineum]
MRQDLNDDLLSMNESYGSFEQSSALLSIPSSHQYFEAYHNPPFQQHIIHLGQHDLCVLLILYSLSSQQHSPITELVNLINLHQSFLALLVIINEPWWVIVWSVNFFCFNAGITSLWSSEIELPLIAFDTKLDILNSCLKNNTTSEQIVDVGVPSERFQERHLCHKQPVLGSIVVGEIVVEEVINRPFMMNTEKSIGVNNSSKVFDGFLAEDARVINKL